MRRRLLAAGIAGYGVGDAVDVLEHALHAPEAAAGEDGGLGRRSPRFVERRRRNRARFLGGRGKPDPTPASASAATMRRTAERTE